MKAYERYKDSCVAWLGKIPEHWELVRGKNFFYNRKDINKNNQCSNILSLTLKGVINNDAENPIGLSPKDYASYQIFDRNNLVFKLIDLENVSTSRVGHVHEHGIMSSAYIRLINRYECNMRYFYFQYYNLYLRNVYNGLGAGVRSTMSASDLLNMLIMIPPLSEQNQIAKFLDEKISKLNKLISIRQQEISELRELKKAIINKAVTKGLRDVQMKDSGVEWIGDIPEGWKVVKLRQLLKLISVKNHPELTLLSVVRERGVIVRDVEDREENHNFIPDDLSNYKVVRKGQFVINKMKAWQGSCGVSNYDGIVSPAYFVFDLKFDNQVYFNIAIRSKVYVNFFAQASDGIRVGQWDLQMDKMKEIPFMIPSPVEQNEIADYLDKKCSQIDALITNHEKQITELNESKARLISDAVTGKIDVR